MKKYIVMLLAAVLMLALTLPAPVSAVPTTQPVKFNLYAGVCYVYDPVSGELLHTWDASGVFNGAMKKDTDGSLRATSFGGSLTINGITTKNVSVMPADKAIINMPWDWGEEWYNDVTVTMGKATLVGTYDYGFGHGLHWYNGDYGQYLELGFTGTLDGQNVDILLWGDFPVIK